MKKTILAVAVGLAVSTSAFAAIQNNMYINLADNSYDNTPFPGAFTDANSQTGIFTQFTFGQLLATSVYNVTDGSLAGSFYDTNISTELTAIVPNPTLPGPGQIQLDGLKPIANSPFADSEGFLTTWGLNVLYHFDGTLSLTTGPSYTGGFFEIYFVDYLNGSTQTKVLGGTLTGSQLDVANLNLFFDLTYAASNFLFIEDPSGNWLDAATLTGVYGAQEFILDTNVDPPIPTADQMTYANFVNVNDQLVPTVAFRQTTLDGSISANIPEPGTLALAGLGLLGLGFARRRKNAA